MNNEQLGAIAMELMELKHRLQQSVEGLAGHLSVLHQAVVGLQEWRTAVDQTFAQEIANPPEPTPSANGHEAQPKGTPRQRKKKESKAETATVS